jgi:hypothetical protein
MPTYDFVNNETGEEFEEFMSMSAREQYLKDNPHIQQIVGATATVSGVSITGKIPDGFKEVLSKVAESHSASAVGQQYGRQSISAIKTKELVKKHIG